MLRTAYGLLLVGLLTPLCALAQFADTFSDGDLTQNPAWTGLVDRWTVGVLDGSPALQSDGPDSADTLFLATPSRISTSSSLS